MHFHVSDSLLHDLVSILPFRCSKPLCLFRSLHRRRRNGAVFSTGGNNLVYDIDHLAFCTICNNFHSNRISWSSVMARSAVADYRHAFVQCSRRFLSFHVQMIQQKWKRKLLRSFARALVWFCINLSDSFSNVCESFWRRKDLSKGGGNYGIFYGVAKRFSFRGAQWWNTVLSIWN